MANDKEVSACIPNPISPDCFNRSCVLPYGLTIEHVRRAMNDFIDFLGFINQQFYEKGIPRLEGFLMPANFSSIVGEFANVSIPKYCSSLVKNQYHQILSSGSPVLQGGEETAPPFLIDSKH